MRVDAGSLEAIALPPLELRLLRRRGRHRVALEMAGAVGELRFSGATAAALFRRRYRHMLTARRAQMVAYAVTDETGTPFFWTGDAGPVYRWGRQALSDGEIAFLADAVAMTGFFRALDDTIALHAAALTDGYGAVAIVGASTAGKSTTAVACVRRGLQLYSDEYCAITPGGVAPFPRALNLRRSGLELLAHEPTLPTGITAVAAARCGGDWEDAGFDELFGSLHVPEPTPLRVVCAIVGTEAAPSAARIPPAAMLRYAKPWSKMKPRGLEGVRALLAALQPTACYELRLGSPDATAQLVARLVAAS